MLLPRPISFERSDGEFTIGDETVISAPRSLTGEACWLQCALRPATGLPLPVRDDETPRDAITLALRADLPAEGFELHCTAEGVRIAGGDAAGVFYGCQALRQLLPPGIYRAAPVARLTPAVPHGTITDRPRFGWRGVMLDVARHFLPKREVLRFIDLMAMHRLNILHLHLSDDQGWRLEIRKYPKLTSVSSWRKESQVGVGDDRPGDGRPHGGFYTQDDIREIVAYAAARHITVVPEIDMPGHMQAVIAAYPEIGVTGRTIDVGTRWGIFEDVANIEDTTIAFFCDILDEVAELFPSKVIHIGGDEAPKTQWENDSRTRELMAAHGISDIRGVQPYFTARMGEHLKKLGRTMAGWDEILEGQVPDGTIISSWRGLTGAVTAARRGHDVVSCPFDIVYLDYRQSEGADEPIPVAVPLDVDDVYAFDPVPPELTASQAEHILGGQANIWTEHMDSPRTVDFFTFPRLAAIAEVLWSAEKDSLEGLHRRMAEHHERLDAVGVEYRHSSGPKPWQTRPGIPGRPTTREAWQEFTDELVADIKE